jgi:hypothetical protein
MLQAIIWDAADEAHASSDLICFMEHIVVTTQKPTACSIFRR